MESIIAAILSGVVTLIGVLIANSRSNAVMEYKIEELNHRMSDIEVHEYEHERSNV